VMLLSHGRYVLLGMVAALAWAAGGLLAPGGGAAAQPQPTIVLSPSSGPCDGMVKVMGSGFLGQPGLRFYLVQPGTADISADFLNSTYVKGDGTFSQFVWLDRRSCDAAALDSRSEQPTGHLTFAFTAAFTAGEPTLQPGDRIPSIIAVAQYAYTTTTTLKPQPTMTITPSSGPCDGSVEITGTNFFDQPGVRFYVLQPGTEDISMGLLNSGVRTQNGNFSQSVWLHEWSCEAAALDSQLEHPTGHLLIAASFTFKPDAEVGGRISNIVAVTEYAYTTTVAQPGPTLVLSPSSGPCDATVEIAGHDFPPNTAIQVSVANPRGSGRFGELASVVTDPSGRFHTTVTLGAFGCNAASLVAQQPAHSGPIPVWLIADLVPPPGPDEILTQITYISTTTTFPAMPRSLPSTGTGPTARSTTPTWLPWVVALAGMGLLLLAGSLYRSRRARS